MASLLSGTTIGGHVAVHANNISTYALTSIPASISPTNVWIGNAIYFGGGNNYLNWDGARINSNVGIQSTSDMRAPIFYDSADTGYYVDPNSTSNLNYLNIGNTREEFPLLRMGAAGRYAIGVSGAYTRISSHNQGSGVQLGFYDGTTFTSRLTVNNDGNVEASTSLRAPIFYDSNNTTYYLDPNASTSGYFAGVLQQNVGKYVRDSHYRTVSGYGDYYSGGGAGWTRVAEIRLTSNCSGAVLYGTLYDHRYDGADAYQISIVARAECNFTSDNESHYINVGCTITGSTAYSNYRDKIRVLLIESSPGSRKYEVQFYETNWNHNTWQLETTGWTILSSAEAPSASVGGERVNYMSNQNADNVRANSAVYSPIYYDSNNTSYYLDPNSITSIRTVGSWRADASAWDGEFSGKMQYHSNHWYIQAADLFIYRNAGGSNVFTINQSGDAQANSSMRAPIFYDSNDTGYYLDPNGNSVLTTATFTTNGSSTITLTSAGTNASMIKAGAGDELYLGGNDTWQMRFNGGNVLMDNGGYLQNNQSLRAPIFYDSDNTGYYVDPNSTSMLYRVNSYYLSNPGDVADNHPYGIYFSSSLSTAYAIFREPGAWNHPYPDLRIAFHTGIKIGANAGYEGVRFYTDYDMSSQVMSVNNGSDPLGQGNVYVNNNLQAGSSLRAPIFYDSADTTYYGDFAGTSWLRHLSVGDVNASNDGGWNARLNLTGSSHARLDVKSNSDGIITTIYSHTGQGVGRVGTWSNHPLAFMVNGGIAGYAYANYLQGVDSVRAPIFYDSADTAYYVDPNSTSNLAASYIGRVLINYDGTDTWFRMQSGNRMRITTTGGTDFIIPNTGEMTYNGNTVIHTGNIGSQSVNYAASAGDASTLGGYGRGNTTNKVAYFDGTRNLYVNNPESYTGEVRLGAAWNRGGVYASSTLSMATSGGAIDFVSNDTTIGAFRWDSTNGSRFIVGENVTTTPYTLIDSNKRPVIYQRGQYPVLTLDHTVTSNGVHGPTIQFVHNGYQGNQWVIGTNGPGTRLDIGFSNTAEFGNTSYNPHNGIGGYNGKTLVRMTSAGVAIGSLGTYPTVIEPAYTLDVRGNSYSSGNLKVDGFVNVNGATEHTVNDNGSVVHGTTTNNRVFINGSIQLTNNNDAIVIGRGASTFLTDEEIGFGWGGGWYMTEGSYIRSRGSKSLHMNGGSVDYVGSMYLEGSGTYAHLQPNAGSYGSLQITNSKGSWSGIRFTASNVNIMANPSESGFHNNDNGWQILWSGGTLYVGKGGYGGSNATVWDSSNAPRANYGNLMYYQGFTLDANSMDSNSTGFTYANNAPHVGPIVRFSTGGGYDLWLNSDYWGGNDLYFRTRNGDTASLNSWKRTLNATTDAYAAGMNQYVRTTDDVTHNSTTSPTFLVNNHSDNTKGYRIHTTSGASVSAMFTNSSNYLVIGAGAFGRINLNKDVHVNGVSLGVGSAAPSGTAGRIDASNDIVAYSSSDERLKYNITPIENAIDKVKSLTGVEFDWKPEYKHAHGYEGHDTGIIAQQVQEVIPSAVRTNDTGFLAVRYEKLIGLLVEGMKEQQAQIEELKAKLDGLTK